jgi:hypothetical protein
MKSCTEFYMKAFENENFAILAKFYVESFLSNFKVFSKIRLESVLILPSLNRPGNIRVRLQEKPVFMTLPTGIT